MIRLWLMMLVSPTVFAGWADVGSVTRVHSGHNNGTVFAFSTETMINVAGCTSDRGYFVSEDSNSSNRIYSLLLTAYTTGEQVAIYTTGGCLEGRPEVNAVQFKKTSYH